MRELMLISGTIGTAIYTYWQFLGSIAKLGGM